MPDAASPHADDPRRDRPPRRSARPEAPFLLAPEPGTTVTYGALRGIAHGLAAELAAHGIGEGEVVSWMLPNGIAAAGVFLGAMYGGYVASPVSLLAQDTLIAHTLAHSRSRIVFAAPEFVARLQAIAAKLDRGVIIRPTSPDDLDVASDSGAERASGTRTRFAGAAHVHVRHDRHAEGRAALARQPAARGARGERRARADGVRSRAVVAAALSRQRPVHRDDLAALFGRQRRDAASLQRVAMVGLGRALPADVAQRRADDHRLSAQRRRSDAGRAAACRAIRFARSASAPLPPEQHRAFESRFGISVLEAMGLTECASVAFANPLEPACAQDRLPRSAAWDGGARRRSPTARCSRDGERGEIELRGANVMLRYHDDAQATAATIRAGGWLATGDLGYRDADGFYFITGRLKELIIKGGENIAPREIDEALLRHPAVLEAAAVGIADPEYGQEILACVVLKANATCSEDELRAHCLAELGRYKTPKIFRFVAELPKGPSGKVQRLKLGGER